MNAESSWTDMAVDLYRVYSTPPRHYHNLDHITELFHELNLHYDLVDDEQAVRLGIWHHDYYQDHHEDEERSATKGYQAALTLGYPEAFAQRVYRLILVTKHRPNDPVFAPQTNDEMFICDIDLMPLAASNFAERTLWVREEYPEVPDDVFFPARKDVLRGFLARPVLYYLPRFRTLYEAKARRNLELAIQ